MSRHPLNPEIEREIATSIHLLTLAGLARNPDWTINNIVFQGGTSVAFAWNSPRFSEDLDFVVARGADMASEMEKIFAYVEKGFLTRHPGAVLNLKNKTKDGNRMSVFMIESELPETIGKIRVKVEFWTASPEAVKAYGADSVYRPLGRADISPIFSVASPGRIMVDKMDAIANREYLKWRDIFDVWYLDTTFSEKISDRFETSEAFKESLSLSTNLYGRKPAGSAAGLKKFLDMPDEDILKRAESDLKPWLPPDLWAKLWPETVATMLKTTKRIVGQAHRLLVEDTETNAPTTTRMGPGF